MIEIYPNLFVGPEKDYEEKVAYEDGWWIVHATNEPYHRRAVGYQGSAPPPDHPEYLFAFRGNRLMLNLIDAVVEVDIPREIFDTALDFIHAGLESNAKVLIHCNQGVSRSASIGLLYLHRHADILPETGYADAADFYEREIYPPFNPGRAIRYFLSRHWAEYVGTWPAKLST